MQPVSAAGLLCDLIPAAPAVPAAAANQKNDEYDDEKRGGVHSELLLGSAPAPPPPQPTLKFTKSLESALHIYGFSAIPDRKTLIVRYRELSKKYRPDTGGLHLDMFTISTPLPARQR